MHSWPQTSACRSSIIGSLVPGYTSRQLIDDSRHLLALPSGEEATALGAAAAPDSLCSLEQRKRGVSYADLRYVDGRQILRTG